MDQNMMGDVLQTEEVKRFAANLLAGARRKWKCGASGNYHDTAFEPHYWPAQDVFRNGGWYSGSVRALDWALAGNFQLTLGGTCKWSCRKCKTSSSDCSCDCSTTCKIEGMVGKYFTFAYVPGGNPGNIVGSAFPAILPTSDFTAQGDFDLVAKDLGRKACGN